MGLIDDSFGEPPHNHQTDVIEYEDEVVVMVEPHSEADVDEDAVELGEVATPSEVLGLTENRRTLHIGVAGKGVFIPDEDYDEDSIDVNHNEDTSTIEIRVKKEESDG